MSYNKKYLKYKQKYLELQNQIGGHDFEIDNLVFNKFYGFGYIKNINGDLIDIRFYRQSDKITLDCTKNVLHSINGPNKKLLTLYHMFDRFYVNFYGDIDIINLKDENNLSPFIKAYIEVRTVDKLDVSKIIKGIITQRDKLAPNSYDHIYNSAKVFILGNTFDYPDKSEPLIEEIELSLNDTKSPTDESRNPS